MHIYSTPIQYLIKLNGIYSVFLFILTFTNKYKRERFGFISKRKKAAVGWKESGDGERKTGYWAHLRKSIKGVVVQLMN